MTNEVWDRLEAVYKPKLMELAQHVREQLEEEGYVVTELSDYTDSDLSISMLIPFETSEDNRQGFDITFRLMDAKEWDGTDNGTNFNMDITETGGRMCGGLTPYNYTSEVWVDPTDLDAVEERWQLFKNAVDVDDIARVLEGE